VAAFARRALKLAGPAVVISSACSSSGKVFASAQRAIEVGLIDAALVGGVDSLYLTTLYGSHELQNITRSHCRPFNVAHKGLYIGAAAFALLERAGENLDADAVLLVGSGESSDAHHMSAPPADGRGARAAMQQALTAAGLDGSGIDYINFHGTATPSNDAAEGRSPRPGRRHREPTAGDRAHARSGRRPEAVICALARELPPAGVNTREVDRAAGIPAAVRAAPSARHEQPLGFGGRTAA
jgi:3-oxoacyl-[acyl-carrier-protein] synthase-1